MSSELKKTIQNFLEDYNTLYKNPYLDDNYFLVKAIYLLQKCITEDRDILNQGNEIYNLEQIRPHDWD